MSNYNNCSSISNTVPDLSTEKLAENDNLFPYKVADIFRVYNIFLLAVVYSYRSRVAL